MIKKILILIAAITGALAIDWLIACGLVKLICLCFTLTFTWRLATGVWLVIIMLHLFLFPNRKHND